MKYSSRSNGIRGIVNDGFHVELALKVGMIVGSRYHGTIAVGSDTRVSSEMFRSAVSAGLMASGSNVVDLGVLPTPAFQYYVRSHAVEGGVMLTASHNPPEYNGIKIIDSEGLEDPFLRDMAPEDIMDAQADRVTWADVGEAVEMGDCTGDYIDAIVSLVDADAIRSADLKVCVECANGSAFVLVPEVLRRLGVRMITMNGSARGELTGRDSELTFANLENLCYLTRQTGCDLGVAFDMDADRCLFADADGNPVPGDKSFSIIVRSVLERRKGKVVAPVSTSSAVEDTVDACGGIMKYSAVGSPAVVKKVMEYGAILGGEINGGIIFPELQYCRDATMCLVKMLECVARNGPLSEQAAQVPDYHYQNSSVSCTDEQKRLLVDRFRDMTSDMQRDITDGVKLFFDDGWVLLRPSATEPVFRVYSQSTDGGTATDRLEEYLSEIRRNL